jgi:hypothetical protein
MNVVLGNCRPSCRWLVLSAAGLVALALPAQMPAQSLVFSNFSSTSGLTINGNSGTTSTSDGTVLRLVPAIGDQAGSVFSTAQRNISGFSTAFQFRLTNRSGVNDSTGKNGADGFVFVVQRVGSTSLGGIGEFLGYSGIGSSVGVEFDTYKNGSSPELDLNSNHIGIDSAGSLHSLITTGTTPVSPTFDDGNLWTAWIDYNGSTLEVRANETGVRPATSLLTFSLDLAGTIGGSSAYVGFTAATGGAWENHDIVKWTFSDHYISGGVTPGSAIPEPSNVAMLAGVLALVATGIWRGRSKSRSVARATA